MAFPHVQAAAVGDKAIAHDFLCICSELRLCGIITLRCAAQPDTALPEQVIPSKAGNVFIDRDMIPDNSGDNREVVLDQCLLPLCQLYFVCTFHFSSFLF